MVLAELKQLASSLGIKGIGAMRKSQLIDAIQSAQRGPEADASLDQAGQDNGHRSVHDDRDARGVAGALEELQRAPREASDEREEAQMLDNPVQPELVSETQPSDSPPEPRQERAETVDDGQVRKEGGDPQAAGDSQVSDRADGQETTETRADEGERGDGNRENRQNDRRDRRGRDQGQARENQQRDNQNRDNQGRDWEEEGGGRRSRRRRSRDRQNRRNRGGGGNLERYDEPVISEDDVLVPARGILDVLDNYAFVRTNGYLPGPDDAYVSLSMVKKLGLRKGDLVTGVIRTPREGERKEKFNPMVRIDTVNGAEVDGIRQRPDFAKLTPLYPQERLKLETTPNQMAGRIIDLVAPIGKGQRALIVSPSKAGKTLIMQAIANAIAINNPEVKLMVVLVDERPEEVTDFERSAKGEVISSTFDRPAEDHTAVAELAIERAKRLVELGHDVVILLDGITRLSRAYNLAAPASGRILSGGVDSAALYPPKKFLGAARNIEGGGSLTIIATALVETGSKMDEVIFEEFKGTGNSEIRLRREFAEKRIFPAIDVDASSTRREELLMSREELAIVWKLRRVLSGLESLQGLEMLLDRLRKTQSNAEFLMAITKTIPTQD
ncbi:MAG TPA: transcription termination factor Rho [Propionibacteriaceae bacterium]|nr:transcription termination factor Rho [Propionibacteriaceae bacterium]